MKNLLKFLAVTVFALFVFTACSNDDDPADNDVFVGTYSGTVSYKETNKTIGPLDGKVRVVKVGNNYNFIFNENIPDLTGVQFEKKGDNSLVNIGSSSSKLITIDAGNLKILYVDGDKTWTANAKR